MCIRIKLADFEKSAEVVLLAFVHVACRSQAEVATTSGLHRAKLCSSCALTASFHWY